MHLDADDAVPFAGLAPTAANVEAEPAGAIAAGARLGRAAEEVADEV